MRLAPLLAAMLVMAGCASQTPAPPTPPRIQDLNQAPAGRADMPEVKPTSPLLPSAFFADGAPAFVAWRCTPAQDLIAAFPDGHLRLWSSLGHYRLERAVVASGARYVKDDLVFWNKGRQATVESDNGRLVCSEDVRRRTLTRRDHPRSIFHALGNEPGWTLDLDRDAPQMVLATDNGEHRYTLDYQLAGLTNGRRASATLQSGDTAQAVTVHLQARACFDTLSGEPYPVRVRVELPDRTLLGCGQGIERQPQ